MSAYTLYIGNKNYSSWSLRPWLLLRERGIGFDEVLLPFEADNHGRFKAVAPNARVPCLHDGDIVVWDSLAIIEYLAERHPGVWPADAGARAWARSAAAEMHSGFAALRNVCPMNCGLRLRLHTPPAAMLSDLTRIDELWCDGLQRFGGPFLAGAAFSAVDAFYAPVAFRVQTYGLPLSAPAQDYATRLLALPGMRDWYQAALREPWREAEHERETLQQAELLADLRL
ncbi:glutathione S-transferase [Arenimonas maotaiensis]|uniref:Glutathione S-transferase n=1 Tax=Arenimonas maotaiensis TaxID=1446479 RepID=A0A917CD27_9GAMM|nr:glutathione S-transferase family protein [Arenimonas maotaiensis]GGF84957.1 glutathione S-transferase [Arenimonas maotaiensis]